jgi:mannosyltransferase OCH1-like enzyme
VQSFRSSGWEHRFYTDDESGSFLSTHFPPEVREAYDTLLPGAFKADLFRYCALFINGGLYADVDILLESNLDILVGPDVGFMAPFDEVSLRLCLFRYVRVMLLYSTHLFCSRFLFSHL